MAQDLVTAASTPSTLESAAAQLGALAASGPLVLAELTAEQAAAFRCVIETIDGVGRLLPQEEMTLTTAQERLRDAGLMDDDDDSAVGPRLTPTLLFLTAPTSVVLVDTATGPTRRNTWYGLNDTVYLLQRERDGKLAFMLMQAADAVEALMVDLDPGSSAIQAGPFTGWPETQNAPLEEIMRDARSAFRLRISRIESDEVVDLCYVVIVKPQGVWLVTGGDVPGVGIRSTAMQVDTLALREAIARVMRGASGPT